MAQKNKPKGKPKDPAELKEPWVEAIRTIVPLLWFALAAFAFFTIYPLAETVIKPLAETIIKQGVLNKFKIGIIEVELKQVPISPLSNASMSNALISDDAQNHLKERFQRLAERIAGATILWVDDNHPYQNVSVRRVFLAANINVDLAKTTAEAINWLSRSSYDVIITDLRRDGDPGASCGQSDTLPPLAGCKLLNTVGACFREQRGDDECTRMRRPRNAKLPVMIAYIGDLRPDLGTPPYATLKTNRADHLINGVLDALEGRAIRDR